MTVRQIVRRNELTFYPSKIEWVIEWCQKIGGEILAIGVESFGCLSDLSLGMACLNIPINT
jgi:hypothetical protein